MGNLLKMFSDIDFDFVTIFVVFVVAAVATAAATVTVFGRVTLSGVWTSDTFLTTLFCSYNICYSEPDEHGKYSNDYNIY